MSMWISVEDNLPKYGDSVLTFDYVGNIEIGYRQSTDAEGQNWRCTNERGNNITYWMPLPYPPAGRKK